jgi:capsular polysaccharide biosynthesis protein
VGSHTTFTPHSFNVVRNSYLKKLGIPKENKPDLKLFLSRPSNVRRHLVNHDEVCTEMAKLGVEVLLGSEPLSVIVEKFSRASHIAAVHGSLLANIIFCGPQTKYLEYCPVNRPDFTFQGKYKLSDNYTHKLIESDTEFNINLDINELIKFYTQ